jgi:hypothetical protein
MNEVKQRLEWVRTWVGSCENPDPYYETWMSMMAILNEAELIRLFKRCSMIQNNTLAYRLSEHISREIQTRRGLEEMKTWPKPKLPFPPYEQPS